MAMAERAPSFKSLPSVPIVDGTGHIWRADDKEPAGSQLAALRDYTISEQICGPYHFGRSLEVALSEWDPDAIVLLGPGASLGGAIGQIVARCGWRGIRSKADFAAAQASATPVLLTPGASGS